MARGLRAGYFKEFPEMTDHGADLSARFIDAVRSARSTALLAANAEREGEPLFPAPERRRLGCDPLRLHVLVTALVALSALGVIGLLAALRAPMTVCVDVSWRTGMAGLAGAATAGVLVVAVLSVRKD
jgi:hypothetical protein